MSHTDLGKIKIHFALTGVYIKFQNIIMSQIHFNTFEGGLNLGGRCYNQVHFFSCWYLISQTLNFEIPLQESFFFMKNAKFSNSEVDGPITGAAFKGQFTVWKYLFIIIFHLMY